MGEPLAKRRPLLESFARRFFPKGGRLRLSPATTDVAAAKKWLSGGGKAVDGIIAKRLDFDYDSGSGERTGMQKVKLKSTADCVVGGFRYGTNSKVIGSLLLGLYDAKGLLHHVGFTSSIKAKDKEKLTRELLAIRKPPGFTGRAPGGPEPLVHRAHGGVGAARADPRRRGRVRPLHRRPLPARDEAPALPTRQGPEAVHDGPDREEGPREPA